LYRLKNGEMPATLTPKIWWVLIGTNDLVGCSAEAVLVGIINIIKEIQAHDANAVVVVNSILPRPGDDSGKLYGDMWENIVWINKRMECYAQADSKLQFFNATDLFLKNDDTRYINETLMPDMLHPSAEGSKVWGTEIVKRIKELVQE
jgi:lysophospholipase L1-like esterase